MAQYKKGESGNPAGRPKNAKILGPAIRRKFQSEPEELQAMVEQVIHLAASGNSTALRIVRGSLDGPEVKTVAIGDMSTEQLLELLEMTDEDE